MPTAGILSGVTRPVRMLSFQSSVDRLANVLLSFSIGPAESTAGRNQIITDRHRHVPKWIGLRARRHSKIFGNAVSRPRKGRMENLKIEMTGASETCSVCTRTTTRRIEAAGTVTCPSTDPAKLASRLGLPGTGAGSSSAATHLTSRPGTRRRSIDEGCSSEKIVSPHTASFCARCKGA